jgi:uncharacterized protein YdhG (YjbR/CyaY superfamily)
MISKATTITQYLQELPAGRRAALEKLRALINRVAPDAAEGMSYGLPSFGDVCAFASQKQYMALYVCDDVLDSYRSQLGKLNCGKCCIRFRHFEDLPLAAVEGILTAVVKRRAQGIGPHGR